ncbi:MAG: sigma 54-interacting transcriptional regulator [Blastocatellia bacterium]
MKKEKAFPPTGAINLAGFRKSAPGGMARESLEKKLEEIRALLDQGLSGEVQARITAFLKTPRLAPSLLAKARCALSQSLEMQGRYSESLAAVAMYETAEARVALEAEAAACIRVQIGLAYNYTGDHPRAIAVLNAALRAATENVSDTQIGAAYVALSRIYRSINEYTIARDHAQHALEHYRHTGDWRGLAESYFALAMTGVFEGAYEPALDYLRQALQLIGDHTAPYLLGKIYTNMAGACWFLKRLHEGIGYLEKAIGYYERTEHKANATDGYNNLGETLILVGDWERAQTALERALALASEIDERGAKVPMILDSLGKLLMLRGELTEARNNLERAAKIAEEHGNKFYAWQPLRTLGQYHLATNEAAAALAKGQQVLQLGETIGDRQAMSEARLLCAEAYLQQGDVIAAQTELQAIAEIAADAKGNLALAGEAQRLHGRLALAQLDFTRAAHHFGRSISIFEMLGDRYHSSRAHYWLGRAYAEAQPERAAEHLTTALQSFQKLGARLDVARAETALTALNYAAPPAQNEIAGLLQLLTLRLTDAVVSRELLLRELAAIVREETNAKKVLITESAGEQRDKVVISYGWSEAESAALAQAIRQAQTAEAKERVAADWNAAVIPLHPQNALPATLLLTPQSGAQLSCGLPFDSLLRIVELGLETCAARDKEQAEQVTAEQPQHAAQSLLPGFIHSSPAMTRLVEEILKIRSSDVTVLVTGESGTGKELVARAIHAHSSRRVKVFVPFNCTAVPKELSDAYLFGYKRGAFTGAVADSPGVIRAAAGGTLFLDEVGDLPLDIQPKLLRFLQEGEIQPLGEQRPSKVDVRVIAATNSDLEEMVAQGRFREDLYYRLNVIRLRVPPLRERRSEIPTIVNHYIQFYSEKFGRSEIQISPQAIDLLMVCDWPGNVRQLTNEIQRVVARAENGALITPEQLSAELRRTAAPASPLTAPLTFNGEAFWKTMTLPEAIDHLERLMISEALTKHHGNISRTARELGMTRRGLQLKLGRYEMNASE